MACNCDGILTELIALNGNLTTKLNAIEGRIAGLEDSLTPLTSIPGQLTGLGTELGIVGTKVGDISTAIGGLKNDISYWVSTQGNWNGVALQILNGLVASLGTVLVTLLSLGTWELMDERFTVIEQAISLNADIINNGINRNYSHITEETERTTKGLGESLYQSLGNLVVDAAIGILDRIDDTSGYIVDYLSGAFGSVIQTLADMYQELQESFGAISESMNQQLGTLGDLALTISEDITKRVVPGIHSIQDEVNGLKSPINTISDNVEYRVISGIHSIQDGIGSVKDTTNRINGTVDETIQKLDVTARTLDSVGQTVTATYGVVNEINAKDFSASVNVSPIIESVTSSIDTTVNTGINTLRDSLTTGINNIGDSVATGINNLGDSVTNGVNSINDSIDRITPSLTESLTNAVNQLGTNQDSKLNDINLGVVGLGLTAATILGNQGNLQTSLNTNTTKIDDLATQSSQCCNSIQTSQTNDRALLNQIYDQTRNNGTGITTGNIGIAANTTLLGNLTSLFNGFIETFNSFQVQFGKLTNWLINDRVIGIMNLAMNVHNGFMLSRNLVDTFSSTVDIVLQSIGFQLRDSEGRPVDLNTVIGHGFNNALISIVGLETATEIRNRLAFANRIYQSSMNAIYNVQSIMDSTKTIVETTATYVGKIGNALKRSGAVIESSYSWMMTDFSPVSVANQKWQKLFTKVEDTENVFSAMGTVASEVISIKEMGRELAVNRLELQNYYAQTKDGEYQYDAYGNPITNNLVNPGDKVTVFDDIELEKIIEPVDERIGQLQARLDSQTRVTIEPDLGKPDE